MIKYDKLKEILHNIKDTQIVPFNLNEEKLVFFDFTEKNQELNKIDVGDVKAFSKYIFDKLEQEDSYLGIGLYNENRTIYNKSKIFGTKSGSEGQSESTENERRTVHLGLDIWAKAGTDVLSALDGTIHSFQDNNAFGDYGPTIVTMHSFEGVTFNCLYGHLSRGSLTGIEKGQFVGSGRKLGQMGDVHENGHWPPHLHFEIIADMEGKEGDFPGVCALRHREKYLEICPDPNLLLKIKALEG